jgi:hypothetical protein
MSTRIRQGYGPAGQARVLCKAGHQCPRTRTSTTTMGKSAGYGRVKSHRII